MIMRRNRSIGVSFHLEESKNDGIVKSEFFDRYVAHAVISITFCRWHFFHSLSFILINPLTVLTVIALVRLNYNFSLERYTNHPNSKKMNSVNSEKQEKNGAKQHKTNSVRLLGI